MTSRKRNVLIAGATALLLGAGIGIVVAGNDDDEGDAAIASTTSPSSTTSTEPGTTTVTTTVTSSPSDPPPPGGVPIGGSAALLSAPPAPSTQSRAPADADCHALGDEGWAVKACGAVATPGGVRVWLVEHKAMPASATEAWRALVVHWSGREGAWVIDLRYADDESGLVYDINVVPSDLTGDDQPELVFGYRFTGSGSVLGYDVVTIASDRAPVVSVHRELSHGVALVADGIITDYDAKYPNNEPNCCPAYIQRSTVSKHGGTWYVTEAARLTEAGTGNL
jgi:hypothetical protein